MPKKLTNRLLMCKIYRVCNVEKKNFTTERGLLNLEESGN